MWISFLPASRFTAVLGSTPSVRTLFAIRSEGFLSFSSSAPPDKRLIKRLFAMRAIVEQQMCSVLVSDAYE